MTDKVTILLKVKTKPATGSLFIVAAPSGAGKTSLVKALLAKVDGVCVSVSHTTRAKRPGEEHGVHYHFIDIGAFERMRDAGEFLEHARVFDNYYGTSQQAVQLNLDNGLDVILEIDWQGARQVRTLFPEAVGIFVLPPSKHILHERLVDRGQDDTAIIERRMRDAVTEISHYNEFDYLIVNDQFESALVELEAVIVSRRLHIHRQSQRWERLLQDLLS